MDTILDEENDDNVGLDSEVLYSIAKWGKVLTVVMLVRAIYFVGKSFWKIYVMQETNPNDLSNQIVPTIIIMVVCAYLPSIFLFAKFYFSISKSLNSNDSQRISNSFMYLKDAIIWNIIALIVDTGLTLSFEHFAQYLHWN